MFFFFYYWQLLFSSDGKGDIPADGFVVWFKVFLDISIWLILCRVKIASIIVFFVFFNSKCGPKIWKHLVNDERNPIWKGSFSTREKWFAEMYFAIHWFNLEMHFTFRLFTLVSKEFVFLFLRQIFCDCYLLL